MTYQEDEVEENQEHLAADDGTGFPRHGDGGGRVAGIS